MANQDRFFLVSASTDHVRAFDLLRWTEFTIERLLPVIPALSAIPVHIRERLAWEGIDSWELSNLKVIIHMGFGGSGNSPLSY